MQQAIVMTATAAASRAVDLRILVLEGPQQLKVQAFRIGGEANFIVDPVHTKRQTAAQDIARADCVPLVVAASVACFEPPEKGPARKRGRMVESIEIIE